MRKIVLLLSIAILSSCTMKDTVADFAERRDGVRKVKRPNIIYKVTFCAGGNFGYKASDVDHMVRIN